MSTPQITFEVCAANISETLAVVAIHVGPLPRDVELLREFGDTMRLAGMEFLKARGIVTGRMTDITPPLPGESVQ